MGGRRVAIGIAAAALAVVGGTGAAIAANHGGTSSTATSTSTGSSTNQSTPKAPKNHHCPNMGSGSSSSTAFYPGV
jgi:hypothetical protein